ncbi:MAG: ABC transporter ATP-binding protein, partial [Candidatus Dormibacteraeota bacterium]|nr:ABC transporter ATP-binding protein [Candidatus Dormibacteraeota bacterium]
MTAPLLQVSDLAVGFPSDVGLVQAVRGVSFEVQRGDSLGIVGESGSGKSTIAQAILGLLPKGTRISGSVQCEGRELLGLSEGDLGQIRGRQIAYIPQDPLSSLNPAFGVGWQIAEAVWTHQQVGRDNAMKRAVQLLELVGIPEAKERAKSYPHEFSGGMRQRVVIAMAMANDPDLIIADEPTTALDVTIQAQVLEALKAARQETHSSLVLITHDLGVVAGMSDQVMVMYAGRAVETGQADDIFYRSRMPYTLGLLGSLPRLDIDPRGALRPIPGSPPSLVTLPRGCPFSPRCAAAIDGCRKAEPELLPVGEGQRAACIRSGELEPGRTDLFQATWADTTEGPAATVTAPIGPAPAGVSANGAPAGDVLIEVKDLVKHFP